MGINTSIATLLSRAREQGTSFRNTLTIGRQSMAVPAADLARDPEVLQKRVQILSRKPVMLWAHAERVSSVPLFAASPYQSDFKAQWRAAATSHESDAPTGEGDGQRGGFRYLSRWKEAQKRFRQWRKHGLHRGKFVSPFDP